VAQADEIVVVVDISRSMVDSDPDQLAVLSTLMLADVLDGTDDALTVVPFDRSMSGPRHRATTAPLRRSDFADTNSFYQELKRQLVYDGDATYFAPPLANGLGAFGKASGRRVLILLTDGASNDSAGDEARFREEILPAAVSAGVQVWMVQLGTEPPDRLPHYFRANRQGGYEHAPTAADLPKVFVDVLGRSTGRRVEALRLRSGQRHTFAGGSSLTRVDIVAFGQGPVGARSLGLARPDRSAWTGAANEDVQGLVQARHPSKPPGTPHGYRRLRLHTPAVGTWTLSAARNLEVLVVTNTRFELELDQHVGRVEVPAGAVACLSGQVLSRANAQARPIPVTDPAMLADLQVRVALEEVSRPGVPWRSKAQMVDDGAAPADANAGDGAFGWCLSPGPSDVGVELLATAELSAFQTLTTRSQPVALRVVEPLRIAATPDPVQFGATGAPLATGQTQCQAFEVAAPASALPEAPTGFTLGLAYDDGGLREAGTPSGGPMRNAGVTLDGVAVNDPTGGLGTPTVSWSRAETQHELCFTPGRRLAGGRGELLVVLLPSDTVYTDYGIEGVISLTADVETPGFLEAYGGLATALLLLLAGGVGYWFVKQPPELPEGLHAATWTGDPDTPDPDFTSIGGGRTGGLEELGLRIRVCRDRGIVVRTESSLVERQQADGTWVAVLDAGAEGPLHAGETYRVGERFVRFRMEP